MSDAPQPIRVLVCDDQALVRTGYVTIFSAQPDIEVVGEAENGHEAVEAARRLRPDVVVMDIRMPLLDGIQATRQLAGPDAQFTPKVLIVTTFNVDAYVYDALRAGASGFLLKDAPPAELVNGIRTVARGEALLAPAVTRHLIGHFAEHLRPADTSRQAREDLVRALTPASSTYSGRSPRDCRTRRSPRRCSSPPRRSRPTFRGSWPNSACATGSRRSSSPTGSG